MKAELTSLIGDTNFVSIGGYVNAEFCLKLEHFNPSGSIKFKTAIGLIESVENQADFGPDTVLIESSSGNLGVALSAVCASRGYKFVCVVDPNTNKENIEIMRAFGAHVHCVEIRDENGGFLGSRIRYIEAAIANNRNYVWLNQYSNPANPAVHSRTTASSIARAFPKLDYLFVGVGTSGTFTGCQQYFHRFRPSTKLIAVDSIGSITFGLQPGPRHIPGLGSSQPPRLFNDHGVHALLAIPEAAAIAACRQFAKDRGMLLGGSSGTVLAAVAAWNEHFTNEDVVVAIAPDGGERYLNTIYNDNWVEEKFGDGPLRRGFTGLEQTIIVKEAAVNSSKKETIHA